MQARAHLEVSPAEAHSLGGQIQAQLGAGRLCPCARVDVQNLGPALLSGQGKQQLSVKPAPHTGQLWSESGFRTC